MYLMYDCNMGYNHIINKIKHVVGLKICVARHNFFLYLTCIKILIKIKIIISLNSQNLGILDVGRMDAHFSK